MMLIGPVPRAPIGHRHDPPQGTSPPQRCAWIAGLLAVLAIALVVTLSGRTADPLAPDGSAVALRAEPGVGATGAVRLSSRPWGTQVDLRVDRLPIDASGEGYAVWLLRADDRRIPAGPSGLRAGRPPPGCVCPGPYPWPR